MLDIEAARERVKTGATLLDEHRPGWFSEIVDEDIDMSWCSRCILGQLYDDFERGMDAIFGYVHDGPDNYDGYRFHTIAVANGLDLDSYEKLDYETLGDLWKTEIMNRRSPSN